MNSLTNKTGERRMVQNSLNEKIPLGAVACMMKWWEPPNTCKYEDQHGIKCDWRIYCEKLSSLLDWSKGFRPKAETIRKLLCRNCTLPKEMDEAKREINFWITWTFEWYREWYKTDQELEKLKQHNYTIIKNLEKLLKPCETPTMLGEQNVLKKFFGEK